jgi:sugar/nucleoside kinase (ribokinase family)
MGYLIVGVKLGEKGLYLHTADAGYARLQRVPVTTKPWAGFEGWHPAFQVKVAGTIGAGDAAYAGFLVSMLHGLDPQEAMRRACAIGACNVEAVDAIGGVRSWEETESRLQSGWPTRPDTLPD